MDFQQRIAARLKAQAQQKKADPWDGKKPYSMQRVVTNGHGAGKVVSTYSMPYGEAWVVDLDNGGSMACRLIDMRPEA